MRTTTSVFIGSLAGLLLMLAVSCNLVRSGGKVQIALAKSNGLDTLTIWTPYNYHSVEWQVYAYENQPPRIGSKSMSEGNKLSGSHHLMNNYMAASVLNLDSLNGVLEHMDTETPYMVWYVSYQSDNDSTEVRGYMFMMFTKDPSLYDNESRLIEIAEAEAIHCGRPFPQLVENK